MNDADYWIRTLSLEPHPEGGWFRESYRAERLDAEGRSVSTAIYFLLAAGQVSHLHRIPHDELWHFYAGSAATIHVIDPDGRYRALPIGPDSFLQVVPARSWFGATLDLADGWALFGCTVAPAFEFKDFELGSRAGLLRDYPEHAALIESLTGPDVIPNPSGGA